MRDWRCTRCGTRASAFGSYETCTWDGPFHDWEEMDEEGPIKPIDAEALRHTGMVHQEYERFMCGCPRCVPVPHVPGCIVPGCPGCTDGDPETLAKNPSPAPGSGTE